MTEQPIALWLTSIQQQVHERITQYINHAELPAPLAGAVHHATLNGGKRIRPALVYAAYASCGGQQVEADDIHRAAVAVELLHCYSLVHDDMPCMDDDALRRGQPTCHIIYGDATALLVGDVLQSLSFEVLTAITNTQMAAALLQLFAPRARRMDAGQMRDINAETCAVSQAELAQIHVDKTGALIEASVLMGATCAD